MLSLHGGRGVIRWGWAIGVAALAAACLAVLLLMTLRLDLQLPRSPAPVESVHIGETVDYVVDYGDIGPIDAATYATLRARMAQAGGTMPNAGFKFYQHGMLWFAFDVPALDTTETNWNVRLDDTRVVNARLIVTDGQSFREFDWARDDALHMAGLGGRVPVFRFQRAELEGRTILVGLTNLAALRADAYVETDRATDAEELGTAVTTSLLDGGLFAVAVFLLIMAIRLRAFTLFAAAGLLTWTALFDFGSKGYLRGVLLFDYPHLADGLLYGTEPLLLSFIVLTIASYVELPRISPRLGNFLVALAVLAPWQGVIALALAVGVPLPFFIDFFPVVLVVTFAGLGSLFWFALVKRVPNAWLFLLGILPGAIGGLLRVYSYLTPEDPAFLRALDSYVDVVVTMMLLGLFAVFDLQRRQEALRRTAILNEQRFRGYAEIASDSYFETDQRGTILSAAGRLVRELGLIEGAALSPALRHVAGPGQDEALARLAQAVARPGLLRDIELQASGTPVRWLSLSLAPYRPIGGGPDGLRGTIADVTERVERRNREARESTLAALGQLAGGVAHEVNNLLHPIVNLARRVRDRQDDPEQRRLLDIVVSSGQHAGEIVAGVLNAFNPANETGGTRPIGPALADALVAVAPTIPSTVRLVERIDLLAPQIVATGEVLQVVSNLASNAIRAMEGRGTITVTLATEGGRTRLSFADDGPGMPEDIRQRATEPFVSGRKGGMGLGLSAVAGLVRKWGGDIDIASAPGRGTLITITLPPPASPAESGAST